MSPVLILLSGIVLLLCLISIAKLNAFISILIATLFIGITNGLSAAQLLSTISKGAGDMLGSVIMVLGLGVVLGSILTETGATKQISYRLLRVFGIKYAKLALAITSFCVGLALFYNAGFIVLIPLVFTVAYQSGLPLVYLAIAMAVPLSVTHGFLPPHPGPVVIAGVFHADVGKTLLYGLMISILVLWVAAHFFPEWIKKVKSQPPKGIFNEEALQTDDLPPFYASLFIALLPVLLLTISTVGIHILKIEQGLLSDALIFVGDPGMSLLIAVLLGILLLGVKEGKSTAVLMDKAGGAVNAIASIILIIAAGGALKQILVDTGTAEYITQYFKNSSLPPLVLGWLVATALRIAIGSATVAGLTASGIVQPLVASMHVKPELMVLAIGAGSLMCSHVNDTGFWMFKEYIGLSLKDTFKTWTVVESLIGMMGLVGVLVLDLFV